jgi:ETC complex I subunit conserved region
MRLPQLRLAQFRRFQSTSPPAGAAAPAAPTAAPAAAPPAPTPVMLNSQDAERAGEVGSYFLLSIYHLSFHFVAHNILLLLLSFNFSVSVPWARYNLESSDVLTVARARTFPVLSQVSENTKGRKVTIYRAKRSAMSSGTSASGYYAIRWNKVEKWGNPLMSYLSSKDTLSPLLMHLKFDSPEAAILLCERNNFEYEIEPTHDYTPGLVDNQYQYNFLSLEVQAKMKAAGLPRRAKEIFANPNKLKDAFVNYKYTQRGGESWKPADYQSKEAWGGKDWPTKRTV